MTESITPSRLFTATRMGAIGAMGVLLLILNLATGTLLVLVTGAPGAGAVLMGIIGPMMYVLARLIIGRFGSSTLMGLVYSVLALPFPIMGTPGFFPKLLTGVGYGIVTDVVFAIFKNRQKLASFIAAILSDYIGMGLLIATFYFFLPPEASQRFIKMLPQMLAILVILGAIGGWLAWIVYSRLRNRAIITRLQQ